MPPSARAAIITAMAIELSGVVVRADEWSETCSTAIDSVSGYVVAVISVLQSRALLVASAYLAHVGGPTAVSHLRSSPAGPDAFRQRITMREPVREANRQPADEPSLGAEAAAAHHVRQFLGGEVQPVNPVQNRNEGAAQRRCFLRAKLHTSCGLAPSRGAVRPQSPDHTAAPEDESPDRPKRHGWLA